MIQLNHKYECCGCSACVQKCLQKCISMQEDEEGFLYPHVEANSCIDCDLCKKVCPMLNQAEPRKPMKCYAAYNLDEKNRRESSSGGVFSLLAEKIINDGGVVYGASWNSKWQVVHNYSDTLDWLAQFRGSKYVQSIIGDSYNQIERFLKDGHIVLFSGTPCQVAGLKQFLCKEYDNLLTIDFICHGVPSPGVFRWYLQNEINEFVHKRGGKKIPVQAILSIPKTDVHCPDGLELKGIRFRDKCDGWQNFSFAVDFAKWTADGKKIKYTISQNLYKNPFLRGFLSNLYLRPSCHSCMFKSLSSGSDITLGDFWGVDIVLKGYNDNKGTSCVTINSKKGEDIFEKITCTKTPVSFSTITKFNTALTISSPITQQSRLFWNLQGVDFTERVSQATKISKKESFINVIRKLYFYLYAKPIKL